jgi:hypothetical protein
MNGPRRHACTGEALLIGQAEYWRQLHWRRRRNGDWRGAAGGGDKPSSEASHKAQLHIHCLATIALDSPQSVNFTQRTDTLTHNQPTPNSLLTQILHMAPRACSDTPALPTCALKTTTTASIAPALPANSRFSPATVESSSKTKKRKNKQISKPVSQSFSQSVTLRNRRRDNFINPNPKFTAPLTHTQSINQSITQLLTATHSALSNLNLESLRIQTLFYSRRISERQSGQPTSQALDGSAAHRAGSCTMACLSAWLDWVPEGICLVQ